MKDYLSQLDIYIISKIMKKRTFYVLLIFLPIVGSAQKVNLDKFLKKADIFMNMNVSEGLVNYQGIIQNKVVLEEIIADLSSLKVKEVSDENYQKAFLINAYNILVIKGVLDNYPVNSPLEIPGFFKNIKYQVADFGEVSLNEIENDLIRKVYKDPRVHFVLVCGAISCPPIIDEAYLPSTLENQLNRQTTEALNNPSFLKIEENQLLLSEIFKWYQEDFKSKGSNEIDFINKYRTEKLSNDFRIGYYPYNWSLNSKNKNIESETSNILEFTPSKLMQKGSWDIKIFNNLYTQNKEANDKREVLKNRQRQSFFTTTLEVYTGVSNNSRINIGGIINLRSNIGNNAPATDVFKFATNHGISRAGISNVGIAVKISPFKKVSNFSLQSNFFIPVFEDIAGSYYLDRRSYTWENRFYFDKSFGADKFQVFAQMDLTYFFGELPKNASADENSGERFANNSIAFPVSVFLSYFPSSKFTIYANAQQYQLVPVVQDGFGQEFTVVGMGTKYQLTSRLNLELSTSAFIRGTSSGLGSTYNLGLRYVY